MELFGTALRDRPFLDSVHEDVVASKHAHDDLDFSNFSYSSMIVLQHSQLRTAHKYWQLHKLAII